MIAAPLAVLEDEGQRNELAEFYEKNKGWFYNIAFGHLHNKSDAEDAVQNAFLAVAKDPESFFAIPQEERVRYMNVIIRNISIRIWNQNKRIQSNQVELSGDIVDTGIPMEERIFSECSRDEIYDFIDTLPEAEKTAIFLRIHLNLKYSDIAKRLEISEEAAKKRINRAANKIKRFMEGNRNERKLHN